MATTGQLLTAVMPWGCTIDVFPKSLAPKSLDLIHSATCRCQGKEKLLVKNYITDWVSYRITVLKEHPVQASTWARATCERLGLEELDPLLGRIEALYKLHR
jgi:hypothetical protein